MAARAQKRRGEAVVYRKKRQSGKFEVKRIDEIVAAAPGGVGGILKAAGIQRKRRAWLRAACARAGLDEAAQNGLRIAAFNNDSGVLHLAAPAAQAFVIRHTLPRLLPALKEEGWREITAVKLQAAPLADGEG